MKKIIFIIFLIAFYGQAIAQWNTNGNNIYNTNSGNVGIGTSTPLGLLYVSKNTMEPMITIRNLGGYGGATFSMIDDGSGADWKFKATLNGGFKIRDHANSLDVLVIEPNSFANAIYIKNTGNIGIGTATPNNCALVDLTSDSKGLLLPRMTLSEIEAIQNPAEGLLAFCTNCGANGNGSLVLFISGIWNSLSLNNCLNPPQETTAGTHITSKNQIIWSWNANNEAKGYKWNVNNDYNTAVDMGLSTMMTESGLDCNTIYNRYLWSYNNCGASSPTILTDTTSLDPPLTPLSGIHISSETQIEWIWDPVETASGYKWSTINDFESAEDIGSSSSKIETGLLCNTIYTRYVWAYNDCGHSSQLTLVQATLLCPSFTCGNSIAINHVIGDIAPVSKTVLYGTVNNVPGEPGKCWITSNLGSDGQALTVNDASESAAGWYWQFNRKQGYKHDGYLVTPNWTITYIGENSNWGLTNDPCYHELGVSWRIPNYTEWNNIDASGGWNDWSGAWNSSLKLHAAGLLNKTNGAIQLRGVQGNYWSSTSYNDIWSWWLIFTSVSCGMGDNGIKSEGRSLRCIRN